MCTLYIIIALLVVLIVIFIVQHYTDKIIIDDLKSQHQRNERSLKWCRTERQSLLDRAYNNEKKLELIQKSSKNAWHKEL